MVLYPTLPNGVEEMSQTPYFEIESLLEMMGKAGKRLAEMNASEGAAGNISIGIRGQIVPERIFAIQEQIDLPICVPELSGITFLVSGSGQRLRDILDHPQETAGCVQVNDGGRTGTLYTSPKRAFQKLTSEFNSHLAVHAIVMTEKSLNYHAIVHAQPLYLTYLSHLPEYQDESTLNHRLFRWQPETIIQFPEGFAVLPFVVPGSDELMRANATALKRHKLAIWSKHGVMACSEECVLKAVDYIEYAEAAARYEYLNLATGAPSAGLSVDEILRICQAFHIQQTVFSKPTS